MIKKYEGLHLTAYCDKLIYQGDKYIKHCPTGNERYSIGYGTKSFPGESITEEEAERRVREYLEWVFVRLLEVACYTDMQKTAIADFMYNSGAYTKHNVTGIYFYDYVQSCDKQTINGFLNPNNYKSKGLKKRRQAQYNYFNGVRKM